MTPDVDLATRLRDLHPAAEPAWWPPAPGWWILLLVALVLAAFAIRRVSPRWRHWRRRRRMLAALDAIARRHRAGAPDQAIAAEVSQLLRGAALERFPEHAAAGLHGSGWIAFLEDSGGTPGRFAALRDALTVAPYGPPDGRTDAVPLLAAARSWLRGTP